MCTLAVVLQILGELPEQPLLLQEIEWAAKDLGDTLKFKDPKSVVSCPCVEQVSSSRGEKLLATVWLLIQGPMLGRDSCFLVLGTLLDCLLAFSCKAMAPAGLLSNIRLLRRNDKQLFCSKGQDASATCSTAPVAAALITCRQAAAKCDLSRWCNCATQPGSV